jgi:hypothetical protein
MHLTQGEPIGTVPAAQDSGVLRFFGVGKLLGVFMGVRSFAAILGLALVTAFAGESRAANFFEKNFWLSGPLYDAVVPLCEDGSVMNKIQWRFAEKESQFWNSALQIVGFDSVREVSFRPGHYAAIPRRFCQAKALISDGSRRSIYYGIGEDTGIIGVTWGVEWCVVGLDRNWAYNPACKAARP